MVVDPFSKIIHFIACSKINVVTNTTEMYCKGVTRLHAIPRSTVSDQDTKFLSNFRVILRKKLWIKLKYSTMCPL